MAMQGRFGGDLGVAAAELAEQMRASVVEVQSGRGGGAGTIWRPDGTVVTNHHVVPGDEARVTLADGRAFQAPVVARDEANDLAILQVDAPGLAAARIGDARRLRTGELVVAVGHPFGVRGTVTLGVVSAAPATPSGGQRELVRADVLLGPGNSGGPLATARGEVVGINAMVSGGLALAVPSHLVQHLLVTRGARPMLGVGIQPIPLSPALAARAGTDRGLIVVQVADDSTAERAGLLVGDVLTHLGDQPLATAEDLLAALAAGQGRPLQLAILRGGTPLRVTAYPARPEQRAA